MTILPGEGAEFAARADVLIVGGGACGLVAALAAAEAGATPVVLERDTRPTGSTTLSQGLIPAAGTRLQRAAGIEDTPALMAADIQAKARGGADAAVVAALCAASGKVIDWLCERHGLRMHVVTDFLYPGMSRHRMHGMPHQDGAELQTALLAACDREGVAVVSDARVVALYADGESRVHGALAARPGGATEAIGCRALVLACSGFGGDAALVREHMPEIAAGAYWGHAGNTGDALRWGLALGAAAGDLGAYQGHGSVALGAGLPLTWAVVTGGGIQVNQEGERFANEMRGYSEHAIEVLRQPGQMAWSVYDARCEGPALAFEEYRQLRALGVVKEAADVGALAAVTGVKLAALERTLAAVAACAAGAETDRFGRDFKVSPALAPPYRAVRTGGALFHTQGGLEVDGVGRVKRKDGGMLPNLFAGGGAARGVSGPSSWGYLAGNGLLSAVGLGWLAGRAAARVS